MGRRIGIIMLSFIMAVSMMPAFAFAEDVLPDDGPAGLTMATPDVELAEPDELLDQFFDVRIAEETEALAGEEIVEEPDAAEEPEPSEGSDEEAIEEPETIDEEAIEESETSEEAATDAEEPVTEDPTAGGLEGGMIRKKAMLASRKSILNTDEQEVYNKIKAQVTQIAAGTKAKAYIEVPILSSSVDYQLVLRTLMSDMPYEFYWYDKTIGYLYGDGSLVGRPGFTVFYFSVSKDYWNKSVVDHGVHCGIDTTKTKRTKTAIDNVAYVVSSLAEYEDIKKLSGYAYIICSLTSYDYSAMRASNNYYAAVRAGQSASPFYGDPWQLISVFDDDSTTNVVCEGYSKAMQYLCDKTSFSNKKIECYTVTGDLITRSGSRGGHMWNIIRMPDGGNYMADLTSCDSSIWNWDVDTTRFSADYFMTGFSSGNVEDGYRFNDLTYIYDDETARGYYLNGVFHKALFTEQEITLSDTEYDVDNTKPAVTHIPATPATCTSGGERESWMRLGMYYADPGCTKWLRHSQTKLPALGHAWATADSLDSTTHTCRRCGYSYTVSKVIVDRPKVKIKKPAKSKAGMTVKWKKVSKKNRKKISGIEIQFSTTRSFAAATSKVVKAGKKSASKKVKKLLRKKTYYVRIRSYKWINGKKHVSAWSAVKKVKTK